MIMCQLIYYEKHSYFIYLIKEKTEMKKFVSLLLVLMMMAAVLAGCGSGSNNGNSNAQAPAETAAENKDTAVDVNNDGYIVMVTDTDEAPVVGATVQFCSDTQCIMGKTDDTGCAIFKEEPGKYTVHVLKADGYVVTEEEYAVPEEYGLVKIVLEKQ